MMLKIGNSAFNPTLKLKLTQSLPVTAQSNKKNMIMKNNLIYLLL